jgi:hypothetical protein
MLGPRRVHRRPLHVVAQVAGVGHGLVDAVGHLVHVQVGDGAVQRRGADEGVDARAFRVAHRLPAAVDVLLVGARQATDRGVRLRLAISETAAKSPSEAIGKPASMMSTPISSRSRRSPAFPHGSWWRRAIARRHAGWCRRSGRGVALGCRSCRDSLFLSHLPVDGLHSGRKYPSELEGQRPSSGDIGHLVQRQPPPKRLAAAAAQLLHRPDLRDWRRVPRGRPPRRGPRACLRAARSGCRPARCPRPLGRWCRSSCPDRCACRP